MYHYNTEVYQATQKRLAKANDTKESKTRRYVSQTNVVGRDQSTPRIRYKYIKGTP